MKRHSVRREQDLNTWLKYIPDSMEYVYNNIIEAIRNETGPYKLIALRTISWIVFARVPIKVEALLEAIAVDVDKNQLDPELLLNDPSLLLQICRDLIEVDKYLNVFRFVHSSVLQFFQNSPEAIQLGMLAENFGATLLAETCVSYLSFDKFSRGPFPKVTWYNPGELKGLIKENPMLTYVCSHWAFHLNSARTATDTKRRWLQELLDRPQNIFLSFQVYLLLGRRRFPAALSLSHIIGHLGYEEFLNIVEEFSLDLDARDEDGSTSLHWAVVRDDDTSPNMVKSLLRHHANINATDNNGLVPLHYASRLGKLEVVKLLLGNGAKKDACTRETYTPLILAAYNNRPDVVEALLAAGADVNIQSHDGTALVLAAQGGFEACASHILKDKRLQNPRSEGRVGSPLHEAAFYGQPAMVKLLLKNGFAATMNSGLYNYPLQATAAGGREFADLSLSVEISQMLIESGADVNAQGGIFHTALQAASAYGRVELVDYLVENGANVNIKGGVYETAYRAAISNNHPGIASILEKHGANPNLGGKEKHPPLVKLSRAALHLPLKVVIRAIEMNEENRVEQGMRLMRIAFDKAISSGELGRVDMLAKVCEEVFDRVILMAREKSKGRPKLRRRNTKESESPTTMKKLQRFMNSGLSNATKIFNPNSRSIQDQNKRDSVDATNSGFNNLDPFLNKFTKQGLWILSRAINQGDEACVKLLAERWTSILERIASEAGTGDQMMEMLIKARSEEFQLYFSNHDVKGAEDQAKAGVELLVIAISRAGHDKSFVESLSDMWVRALQDVVENDHGQYSDLESFLNIFIKDLETAMEAKNEANIIKLVEVGVELHMRAGAGTNERLTEIMAELWVNAWKKGLAMGMEAVFDKIFSSRAHEFWSCVERKDITRAANLSRCVLGLLHASVGNMIEPVARKISLMVVTILKTTEAVGENDAKNVVNDLFTTRIWETRYTPRIRTTPSSALIEHWLNVYVMLATTATMHEGLTMDVPRILSDQFFTAAARIPGGEENLGKQIKALSESPISAREHSIEDKLDGKAQTARPVEVIVRPLAHTATASTTSSAAWEKHLSTLVRARSFPIAEGTVTAATVRD